MLKAHVFVIAGILSFIFLVFAYGRMGQIPFDKSILIAIGLFLMLYSVRAFEVEMKYRSPKFVSDPIYSTANWSDGRIVGNYAVIKLGAFQAYGFHYSGGDEGTAIIRKDALNKIGESVGATCKLRQISIDELPPEVYDEREFLGIQEPVYRGDLDIEEVQSLKKSELGKIQAEILEKDKYINMQKDLLDGKFDSVEKFVEGSSRIIERKKGVGAFLKNMFIKDRTDEDS